MNVQLEIGIRPNTILIGMAAGFGFGLCTAFGNAVGTAIGKKMGKYLANHQK